MNSDELFPSTADPQAQWLGLEKRINLLLEGIVQLRNANALLMKENVQIKNQMKEKNGESNGAPTAEEFQKLKKQYEEALEDLKKVKQNLQHIEKLAEELKLEDTETVSEG